MSELEPIIQPLDGAGHLATATGVNALVRYSDLGSGDTTLVKWGIYDPIRGPGATRDSPDQLVPIPARHICDGYATVWFSITDAIGNVAYSSLLQVSISTDGVQVLKPPQVTAVNAANPSAGLFVTVTDDPAFDLALAAGDTLDVMWSIFTADGSAAGGPYNESYTLPAGLQGSYTTPALYQVPTGTQYMVVSYALTRSQPPGASPQPASDQQFLSGATQKSAQDLWPGGGPAQLPAPVFPDAVSGTLNLDQVPGDIRLQIPATPLLVSTNVDFEGSGQDTNGQPVANASWSSGFVPVAGTPYDKTPVPRGHVEAVPTAGSYSVYYQGAGLISPVTTVIIQHGSAQPPEAGTGQLWGWGDPEYGTLG